MQYRLSTLLFGLFHGRRITGIIWCMGNIYCLNSIDCRFMSQPRQDFRIWDNGGCIHHFYRMYLRGLLTPAIAHAPEAARRAACINNLKQIGSALQYYHDANNHFPPANICDKYGKPLLSWRVETLPILDYGNIYDSLKKDEPWNSPNNGKLINKLCIPEYWCPSDFTSSSNNFTSYVAVIGPGHGLARGWSGETF